MTSPQDAVVVALQEYVAEDGCECLCYGPNEWTTMEEQGEPCECAVTPCLFCRSTAALTWLVGATAHEGEGRHVAAVLHGLMTQEGSTP